MIQVGLVGELSDTFLDCLIEDGLESVPMLHCVDVTLTLELEDGLEAITLVFCTEFFSSDAGHVMVADF